MALNRQLVMLSRVVLHPTYRGAGLAADFVRDSCRMSGFPWVESLAQMGHVSPFFERAGFVRVGCSDSPRRSRAQHDALYGGRSRHAFSSPPADGTRVAVRGGSRLTQESHDKSRYASPVYYILDNREYARPDR